MAGGILEGSDTCHGSSSTEGCRETADKVKGADMMGDSREPCANPSSWVLVGRTSLGVNCCRESAQPLQTQCSPL